MLSMSEKSLLCLVLVLFVSVVAHGSVDVIDYSTRLEPDITSKSVKGTVSIRFTTAEKIVEFECGDLIVDSVVENGKLVEFSVNNHKLKVSLAAGQGGRNNKRAIETRSIRFSQRASGWSAMIIREIKPRSRCNSSCRPI